MDWLDGKTALVTGATSGIGWETARGLSALHAQVIVHGRSDASAQRAVDQMRARQANAKLEAVAGDFSSFKAVRQLAAHILKTYPRLDILILNAGLVTQNRVLSADGLELQIAVNHLGPFLFTLLLLERLKASAPARIVVVSSGLHRRAKLDVDDLMFERRRYDGIEAYAQSKLANLLFARKLAADLKGSGVTVNALHPGVVGTDLARHSGSALQLMFTLMKPFMMSPKAGAKTSLHLAASSLVQDATGGYYEHCLPVDPSVEAQRDDLAQALWDLSVALTDRDIPAIAS
jgi:NAD(P)-dependent dehydrogenase (short-subunit alcohol dehydrogenase family)